jgi:hypothetical protein
MAIYVLLAIVVLGAAAVSYFFLQDRTAKGSS